VVRMGVPRASCMNLMPVGHVGEEAGLAVVVCRVRRRGPRSLLAAWARVGRTAAAQYRKVTPTARKPPTRVWLETHLPQRAL
jgi:hypothetical protein